MSDSPGPTVPPLRLSRRATTSESGVLRHSSTSRDSEQQRGRRREKRESSRDSLIALVSPRRRRMSMSLSNNSEKLPSAKELAERLEKQEEFSNNLSKDVLELVGLIVTEASKEDPLKDEETKSHILRKCVELQEFCIKNKPAKTWSAPPELKHVIRTTERRYVYHHHYHPLIGTLEAIEEPKRKDKKSKTGHIIHEIVTTERDYLRDLAILIGYYEMPLKHELNGLVPLWDIHTLFKNCSNLFATNVALYKRMVDEIKKPEDRQDLGRIFLDLMDKLQAYNIFCVSREIAQEVAQRLMSENDDFRSLAQQVRQVPDCRNLEFESFMIAPFQRVTRYPLLLKELAKTYSVDSPHHQTLQAAIMGLGEVVKEANETQRTVDQFLENMDIQLKFHSNAKFPQLKHLYKHKLLKEGPVKRLDDSAQIKKSHLWIFDEMIILSTERGSKHYPTHVMRTAESYGVDITSMSTGKSKFEFLLKNRRRKTNREKSRPKTAVSTRTAADRYVGIKAKDYGDVTSTGGKIEAWSLIRRMY